MSFLASVIQSKQCFAEAAEEGSVFEVGLCRFSWGFRFKHWRRATLIGTESVLKPRRKDIFQ